MQKLGEVQDTPSRDPLLWVEWMVHAEPFHVAASPIWPTARHSFADVHDTA
jgi:hypothetical protein